MASPAPATASIARLAADRRVHQAFQWLHLQEQRILQWQAEMVAVPAPPFGERARAEWLCERFRELGLENPHIDEVGNAIGTWPGKGSCARRALLSAHIDTVFPAGTPIEAVLQGSRLSAPGACDNGAGVAAMLAMAAAMRHAGLETECEIQFVAMLGKRGKATCAACGISIGTGARRGSASRGISCWMVQGMNRRSPTHWEASGIW
jgi:hypothetical protein